LDGGTDDSAYLFRLIALGCVAAFAAALYLHSQLVWVMSVAVGLVVGIVELLSEVKVRADDDLRRILHGHVARLQLPCLLHGIATSVETGGVRPVVLVEILMHCGPVGCGR
jgi:hypothetical protein